MRKISFHLLDNLSGLSVLGLLWFLTTSCGGGTVISWCGTNVNQLDPSATNVVAIAAGCGHSLLLKDDGTVAAFGVYLLPPTYPLVTVPAGLTGVVAVAGGDSHSLALKADGTVVAWGINTDGQTNVPPDLTNVVAISAGAKHSLALKADGTVVGWGTSGTNAPDGLTNIVAIAAGRGDSLVLKADGTVVGWGVRGGTAADPSSLSNIVAISAGDNCCYESWEALQADGSVVASGPFGGTTGPVLSNVVAISASRGTDWHISLALMTDGTVAALPGGFNVCGGASVPADLTNVVAVAAGGAGGLALIGDGPPVLQALLADPTWDSEVFRVSVPTQNGRVYRLEYKDTLADSDWLGLPLVAGNGGLRTLNDPTAAGTQRFYRVRRW